MENYKIQKFKRPTAQRPVLPILRLKASFRTTLKSSTGWFPTSATTSAKTIALAGLKTKVSLFHDYCAQRFFSGV